MTEEQIVPTMFLFRAHPGAGHWRVEVFAGVDRDHRARCGELTLRDHEAFDLLRIAAQTGHEATVVARDG